MTDCPAVCSPRDRKPQITTITTIGKTQVKRNWERKLGREPLKVILAASSWLTNFVSGSTRSVRNKNGLASACFSAESLVAGCLPLPPLSIFADLPPGFSFFSLGTIRPVISSSLTSHSATSPAARDCLNWL